MRFGIYQTAYVVGLEAEVARLRERETRLLNTAFSLHGISAPFAPPQTDHFLKPYGRKSWSQRRAELEDMERIVERSDSSADQAS